MNLLSGYRSQITAAVGVVFTLINSFYPDMLSAEVQGAVVTLLVFVYGLFLSLKVKNK